MPTMIPTPNPKRTNQAKIVTISLFLGYGVFATKNIKANRQVDGIRGELFVIAKAQQEVCMIFNAFGS